MKSAVLLFVFVLLAFVKPHGLLASPAGYPIVNGEIRKIDSSAAKLTIRHEEIPNLDMPPMTMVFRVADLAILDSVVLGQKVRFVADTVNGQITVLWLEVR